MSDRGVRADWLHEAKWGVFMHFLAAPAGTSQEVELDAETWNRRVDAFDVPGAAQQLLETKARYFVLTLGQNSGHFCAPNATYDRITGIRPSLCARRDLVTELHDALAPHGIRVMVYTMSGAPEYAPRAVEKLEWSKGSRCVEFQRKWESVIRDWSLRWGRKVSGWWFDSCYFNDVMYRHADEPNFKSFAAAIRAGNPDSIIGWNPGITHPPYTVDVEEDYTAGEVNEPQEFDSPGRWDKHAQFHVLTYLGKDWGQLPIRFTAAEAIAHTLAFTNYGGAVTWDVPLTYEGHIDPGAFKILKEIGKAVDATRGKPDMAPPKVVRPSVIFLEAPASGDKGKATKIARISLRNNWSEPIHGRVALSMEPAASAKIEGEAHIAYALDPGAESRTEVRFILGASASDNTPARLVLSRTGSDRQLAYPVPRRQRIRILKIDTLPSPEELSRVVDGEPARNVIIANGYRIAEIKFAIANGHLAIFSRVRDQIMRQTPGVWSGSCMEVFGVAESGDRINQLFFVPATADAPAKTFYLVRTEQGSKVEIVPTSELKYTSWAGAGGYTSAAFIPLAWWLKRPTPPDAFLFEIVVSAGIDARAFDRATLFGSSLAPLHTDGYAIAEY